MYITIIVLLHLLVLRLRHYKTCPSKQTADIMFIIRSHGAARSLAGIDFPLCHQYSSRQPVLPRHCLRQVTAARRMMLVIEAKLQLEKKGAAAVAVVDFHHSQSEKTQIIEQTSQSMTSSRKTVDSALLNFQDGDALNYRENCNIGGQVLVHMYQAPDEGYSETTSWVFNYTQDMHIQHIFL